MAQDNKNTLPAQWDEDFLQRQLRELEKNAKLELEIQLNSDGERQLQAVTRHLNTIQKQLDDLNSSLRESSRESGSFLDNLMQSFSNLGGAISGVTSMTGLAQPLTTGF